MRKTLTIVAALLAAFFLTSCDQLLEEFYPEFADSGSGKGGVVVNINYDQSLLNDTLGNPTLFSQGSRKIFVSFVPFISYSGRYEKDDINTQTLFASKSEFSFDPSKGGNYKEFTFQVKTNATYKVIVWLDNDGDEIADVDEPGSIVYTNDGDYFLDLSWYSPDQDTIYLGTILRKDDRINQDQFLSDPSAGGTGGTRIPTVWLDSYPPSTIQGNSLYFSMGYDDDGWVENFEWVLTKPNSERKNFYGQFVNISFDQTGTYTLSYRAKDNDGLWSADPAPTVTIEVFPSGGLYDPFPIVDFDASNWNPIQGNTVWFYNSSYDYDSTGAFKDAYNLSSNWAIHDSSDAWVAGGSGTEFNYTFLSAGSYTIYLTVTDSAYQSSSTNQMIWVGSNTALPGDTMGNPIVLNLDAAHTMFIPEDMYHYYHFVLPGGTGVQNLRFTGLTSDIDFAWYSDPGFYSSLGSSYSGGTSDESWGVTGYTDIYLEVDGYLAGNYTVSVTSY